MQAEGESGNPGAHGEAGEKQPVILSAVSPRAQAAGETESKDLSLFAGGGGGGK